MLLLLSAIVLNVVGVHSYGSNDERLGDTSVGRQGADTHLEEDTHGKGRSQR